MRRHPSLAKRKPQTLQIVRARAATARLIDDWFDNCLQPALTTLNLIDKPHCIFNADETYFCLSGRPQHVLARRGSKAVHSVIGGSGRDNVTVQACISGEGKLLPPFIVFTGKHLMHAYTNGGPLGTRFTVSKNGWMDTNGFVEWMKKIFITSLPDERPVILIIDGHLSHVSYEVRQLARENNVTMLKLPSHLTHILQPLDVSVFKGMKAAWDTEVSTYTRLNRKSVTKKDFASILGNVWKKYDPQSGVNGF